MRAAQPPDRDSDSEAGSVSAGERALTELLSDSHLVSPQDLAGAIARSAATLGAVGCVVYLTDYEQATLVPLHGGEGDERRPLGIDTTIAGRAFRFTETIEAEDDGGLRLWVPMLDGTTRVGSWSCSSHRSMTVFGSVATRWRPWRRNW